MKYHYISDLLCLDCVNEKKGGLFVNGLFSTLRGVQLIMSDEFIFFKQKFPDTPIRYNTFVQFQFCRSFITKSDSALTYMQFKII